MIETAIKIEKLSKMFKIYRKNHHRFLEPILRKKLHKEYWALKNINLEVKKGEAIGIIGANGAGKSTLLKIICGALYQSSGNITINGKILSLLELGTGFHPELTGIENIFNSASMQGFSYTEINNKLNEIIEFADIGDHIYSPVKTYSSGMYVRLAFALYACLDPDIYIVDEALSVGDVFFQQKCYERMRQMKQQGVTIIVVSHDPSPIVNFCNRAILLDKGEILCQGSPSDVLDRYQALEYHKGMKSEFEISNTEESVDFGNKAAELVRCAVCDEYGNEISTIKVGDKCRIYIEYQSSTVTDDVCVGIQIKNRLGVILYGTNSNWQNVNLVFKEGKLALYYEFPVNLYEGSYTITVAATENKHNPQIVYSWKEKAAKFDVVLGSNLEFGGEIYLPVRINQVM